MCKIAKNNDDQKRTPTEAQTEESFYEMLYKNIL